MAAEAFWRPAGEALLVALLNRPEPLSTHNLAKLSGLGDAFYGYFTSLKNNNVITECKGLCQLTIPIRFMTRTNDTLPN